MTKEPPKTYEEAVTMVERMNKKRKKQKELVSILVILAVMLGLVIGDLIGFQTGYHQALAEFHISQGMKFSIELLYHERNTLQRSHVRPDRHDRPDHEDPAGT